MNKYIYALFGLYFLLSCQKSQSRKDDLSNPSIRIVLSGDLVTQESLSNKSEKSNSDLLYKSDVSCRQ